MKHTIAIDDKYFGEYGLTEEVTEIKLNELKKHKETFFRISLINFHISQNKLGFSIWELIKRILGTNYP